MRTLSLRVVATGFPQPTVATRADPRHMRNEVSVRPCTRVPLRRLTYCPVPLPQSPSSAHRVHFIVIFVRRVLIHCVRRRCCIGQPRPSVPTVYFTALLACKHLPCTGTTLRYFCLFFNDINNNTCFKSGIRRKKNLEEPHSGIHAS